MADTKVDTDKMVQDLIKDNSDDEDENTVTEGEASAEGSTEVISEKEKQLRDSLMKDIYNDMSSSSDEEDNDGEKGAKASNKDKANDSKATRSEACSAGTGEATVLKKGTYTQDHL